MSSVVSPVTYNTSLLPLRVAGGDQPVSLFSLGIRLACLRCIVLNYTVRNDPTARPSVPTLYSAPKVSLANRVTTLAIKSITWSIGGALSIASQGT